MARLGHIGADAALAAALEAVGSAHEMESLGERFRAEDFQLLVVDCDREPRALERLLRGRATPALLVVAGRETALPPATYDRPATAVLRKPFDLFELRARLRGLLGDRSERDAAAAVRTPEADAAPVEHTWFEGPLLARARTAVRLGGPLVLLGEPGVGRARLARQLARECGLRLQVWGLDEPHEPEIFADAATLVWVPALERRSAGDQARLAAAIDESAAVVVAGACTDLERLVCDGVVTRDLFHRLNAVLADLKPLRERTAELPELVASLLADLAARADLDRIRLAPDALARLSDWNWPGNLVELESVLLRSVARAVAESAGDARQPELVLDRASLVMAPELVSERMAGSAPQTARRRVVVAIDDSGRRGNRPAEPAAVVAPRDAALDLLVAGLAHDLRNPMATIKTFAALSAKSEGEDAALARLAAEACERIDGELDLLHLYCDLPESPEADSVDLVAVFEEALALASTDGRRAAELATPGRPLHARVDRRLAGFLAAALAAQAAAVPSAVVLRLAPDQGPSDPESRSCRIELSIPAGNDAAHALTHLLDSGDALPWRLALAANVANRAGGNFERLGDGDLRRLLVTLPAAHAAEEEDDGQQTRRADRG